MIILLHTFRRLLSAAISSLCPSLPHPPGQSLVVVLLYLQRGPLYDDHIVSIAAATSSGSIVLGR